jgi:transposase
VSDLTLTSPTERPIRRRTRRDLKPHFKANCTQQLDAVLGCPELIVPKDHMARAVLEFVGELDLGAIDACYSSLGRHGINPRNKLAVWIYGRIDGQKDASVIARRIRTDAAYRLVAGGHTISSTTLKQFRLDHAEHFEALIEQTVQMALARSMLNTEELAIDSLRLRAHASKSQVRTRAHSEERLEELSAVDEDTLDDTALAVHQASVAKHAEALDVCDERSVNSVVMTNPLASMMKFPDGGTAPAHRVTALSAGARARFIVAVLVTADANDSGLLEPIVEKSLLAMAAAGVPKNAPRRATADAGYCSHADLAYAERARDRLDVLINITVPTGPRPHLFGRDRFIVDEAGAICPADRRMQGPWRSRDGSVEFVGVGCTQCPLRTQCTDGKARSLTIHPELERLRTEMQARLATDEGKRRYSKRMAVIEPVFSNLESVMNFRRAASRHAGSVVADVLLAVLAHNVSRLVNAKRLFIVYCMIDDDGTLILAN